MTPIGGTAIESRWIVCAGIDPGARTGMIAIAVERDTLDITQGRLVGEAIVDIGSFGKLDEPLHLKSRTLKLMKPISMQLARWNPARVVIENPTEAMPVWGQGQAAGVRGGDGRTVLQVAQGVAKPKARIAGASRGTIATLGVHLGICAAAIMVTNPEIELFAYHVTAQKEKKRKRGHVGWMRGMNRARVLMEMGYLLRTLRARPHGGILPTREAICAEPDENVLMALGVLNFHLQRERGGRTT